MKKLALAIIMAMLGTFSYAAGNEIYIDQVGDGDTINITQTGSTNKVGSSTTDAVINGGGNTVTIDQVGNNNEVVMSVGTTSGGATVTTSATGVPVLPGTLEIFSFPTNSYFTAITSSGTSQIYVTPGFGV